MHAIKRVAQTAQDHLTGHLSADLGQSVSNGNAGDLHYPAEGPIISRIRKIAPATEIAPTNSAAKTVAL